MAIVLDNIRTVLYSHAAHTFGPKRAGSVVSQGSMQQKLFRGALSVS